MSGDEEDENYPVDLVKDMLTDQIVFAKMGLKRHLARVNALLDGGREPHEAPEAVEEPLSVQEPAQKKARKPRKPRKPVEGPCVGHIWLDEPAECPTVDAPSVYRVGVYAKKKHAFCPPCKKALDLFRRSQKEKKVE